MNNILKDKMAKRTFIGVIVVVILLGLYGGLYLLTTSTQAKIPEDVQKNIDDVNEMASEYNEIKENNNKIISENTAEYNNYEELLNELQEIVDENGIVKKGYEERVKYIAKVLTEVTGIEIKVVDGVLTMNTGKDTEKEITTKPPTEKPTEPPTEKPTKKATEPQTEAIKNETTANGFWAKGNGDYVTNTFTVNEYAVLNITCNGDNHFSVTSYQNDEYDDLLVNTSGAPYTGKVLIDHSGDFELAINSKNDWNITSSGLSIDDSTYFSGYGDSVTGITTHDGGNWKITNNGDGHFSVKQYGLREGYMELLVNTSDNYSGIVKADAGDNIFFVISSKGNWTIEKIS